MIEYPKRVYVGGKGYTVNNIDEEQELLSPRAAKVIELSAKEDSEPEQEELTPSEQKAEALEYLVSKGYSKNAAKSILKKEGLEVILKHMAEGTDPQE